MKYVVVLGDGMADLPLEQLDGKRRWHMQRRLLWMTGEGFSDRKGTDSSNRDAAGQ